MIKATLVFILGLSISACGSMSKMVHYEDQTIRETAKETIDPLDQPSVQKIDVGAPLNSLIIKERLGKITINGKSYINDFASIEDFSKRSDTGQITYTSSRIKNGKKITELFLDTPFTNKKPLLIATVDTHDGSYVFTHSAGSQRKAKSFRLFSQGAFLEHDGGFFSYLSAQGFSPIHEIPKDFQFSPIQAKDISKARFVALIRDFGPVKMGFLEVRNMREYEIIFVDAQNGSVRSADKIRLDVENQEQFDLSLKQRIAIHMTNKGLVFINISSDYKNIVARNLHKGIKKSLDYREHGIAKFWSDVDNNGNLGLQYTYGASEKRNVKDVNQALGL